MGKTMCAAAILLAASGSAVGSVYISASLGPDPCEVVISYDASSEPNLVRGFALDITLDRDDVNFVDVNCISADYYVYMGSIEIDDVGRIADWASCLCSADYPGTLGGLDTNGVTIEMMSLYVGEANAPASSGDLVVLTLGECYDGEVIVSVGENVIRGGVVMEDPYEMVTVVTQGCTVTCDGGHWCWEPVCAGQPSGDGTCDGSINLADLFALKAAFGKSAPWSGSECCSDYNHDQSVNLGDLFILKAGFGSSGYFPSTGSQICP